MSTEATSPTGRAGALVYRIEGGRVYYLLVSAKVDPNFYIVPQGKIKSGESPEAAARRETLEEAGIEIAVERRLGAFQHEFKGRRFHPGTREKRASINKHRCEFGRIGVYWGPLH